MGLIQRLFSTDGFMPHEMCYGLNPAVIWLHVVSDALIAIAYFSIPLTLVYFVRQRKDLVFDWMFLCFAVFIVACGTTHLMEILNIWHPTYWLSGVIKAITALTSIVTAILLVRLVPMALALPSPAQLRRANQSLQKEVDERKQASDRIERLNTELLSQTAKLEAANQELEAFGYTVSHDLRAPLRHIDGYVDMLRDEAPAVGEKGTRYMKVISESAKQMGLLIDGLLAFSRMGRSAMTLAPTAMAKLIEDVRVELAPDMKDRTIEWHIGPLPSVRVDRALFKLVWTNLLSNAVKYTKNREKTVISIGYEEKGAELEFFVKDNGAGFDMKYIENLFGIFQRLHLKEEFEGTGIGLANVRRIVARHGGRTWAQGELDAGATFYFTIPKTSLI
jgi:signal transduction histidine kinase